MVSLEEREDQRDLAAWEPERVAGHGRRSLAFGGQRAGRVAPCPDRVGPGCCLHGRGKGVTPGDGSLLHRGRLQKEVTCLQTPRFIKDFTSARAWARCSAIHIRKSLEIQLAMTLEREDPLKAAWRCALSPMSDCFLPRDG